MSALNLLVYNCILSQQRNTLQMQKHLVDDVMPNLRKQGRVVDGGGKQTDPEAVKVRDFLKGISEAASTPAQQADGLRKAHEYAHSRKSQPLTQLQDIVTLSTQARQMLTSTLR